MLYCIPTNGNSGVDDTVSEHFGSASFFTLYDSEQESLEVLENRNSHHSHGTCHPMTQLNRYQIDGIICSGIGRRAIEALQNENITVYTSAGQKVSEIIDSINNKTLQVIDPLKACHGHGQHHIHQRGNGYQHGHNQGQGQNRRNRR